MKGAYPGDDRVAIFHEGKIRHERGYSCPASPARDIFRGSIDGDFAPWRAASSGAGDSMILSASAATRAEGRETLVLGLGAQESNVILLRDHGNHEDAEDVAPLDDV